MTRSFTGFLVLGLVAFTGCNQGTPGGPGAADKGAKKSVYGQADDTFSLSVPTLSTTLKQGETTEGSIGIKRGKNFDEAVTVALIDLPSGVTFASDTPVIKPGDTEVQFTLKAGDDAALGDFTVKVTGHPAKGPDATNEFKISVAKKATFHLSAPFLSTSLKQGETKEVSIGIKRDKNFDQDVALAFTDLPVGVTFTPVNSVIKPGDTEAKITIKGADDAAVGDFKVKVTGHPTKGADASTEFKVSVAKKAAVDAKAEAAKAKRDEYVLQMQKQLDVLDVKYEALKSSAAKAEGQAKKDLEKVLAEAKVKRDAAAKKLDELKKADETRWEKIKDGVGSAFEDLKKAFK
jgi:hypothetical protein